MDLALEAPQLYLYPLSQPPDLFSIVSQEVDLFFDNLETANSPEEDRNDGQGNFGHGGSHTAEYRVALRRRDGTVFRHFRPGKMQGMM